MTRLKDYNILQSQKTIQLGFSVKKYTYAYKKYAKTKKTGIIKVDVYMSVNDLDEFMEIYRSDLKNGTEEFIAMFPEGYYEWDYYKENAYIEEDVFVYKFYSVPKYELIENDTYKVSMELVRTRDLKCSRRYNKVISKLADIADGTTELNNDGILSYMEGSCDQTTDTLYKNIKNMERML